VWEDHTRRRGPAGGRKPTQGLDTLTTYGGCAARAPGGCGSILGRDTSTCFMRTVLRNTHFMHDTYRLSLTRATASKVSRFIPYTTR